MKISWVLYDGGRDVFLFDTDGQAPIVGQDVCIHNNISRPLRSKWRNGDPCKALGEGSRVRCMVKSVVVVLSICDASSAPREEYHLAGIIPSEGATLQSNHRVEVTLVKRQ